MKYAWITFIILLILIPISIIYLRNFTLKSILKNNATKEQKRNANLVTFKSIIFCYLWNFFYLTFLIDFLQLRFVFGCLIIAYIFTNISSNIITEKKKSLFDKVTTLTDFIIGVGLSIYLISIIKDKELQQIILNITSALYGGLITLIGVAWTIKKSDYDKKEVKKNKKPIFAFYIPSSNDTNLKYKLTTETEKSEFYYSSCSLVLENSNNTVLKIKTVLHDGIEEKFKGNDVLLPNKECFINFNFRKGNVFIKICDEFENEFYYKLNMEKDSNFTDKTFNEISINYVVTEIIEYKKDCVDLLNLKIDDTIKKDKDNFEGDKTRGN